MDHQILQRRNFFDDLCGLSAVAAAVMVLYATGIWGPAISNDSFPYLMAAHNLAHGNGLAVPRISELAPMTAWPPLFPSAISLVSLSGIEIKEAARWLNTFMLAMNIMLASRLIRRATDSGVLAFLGAVLLASSTTLLRAHSHVWSEPLFFTICLISITLLVKYIEAPSLLTACFYGLAAGLTALTRYAGLSLALTGVAVIIFLTSQPIRRRLLHSLAAAIIAIGPLAMWFVRNTLVARDLPGRTIRWCWPDMAVAIPSLLGDTSQWFLPKAVPPVVRGMVLIIIGVFMIWLIVSFLRDIPAGKTCTIPLVMLIFMVCYEAVVLATVFLMDPLILAYERLQLPMFVAAVIFATTAAPMVFAGRPAARVVIVIVAIVFAAASTARATIWTFDAHANGQSFSSTACASNPLIVEVRKLPQDAQIFSNSPQAIYAQTGRIAWMTPVYISLVYVPNSRWKEDIELLHRGFAAQKSFVVVFTTMGNNRVHPVERDIEANLVVRRIYEGPDGIIFARPD